MYSGKNNTCNGNENSDDHDEGTKYHRNSKKKMIMESNVNNSLGGSKKKVHIELRLSSNRCFDEGVWAKTLQPGIPTKLSLILEIMSLLLESDIGVLIQLGGRGWGRVGAR